MNSAQDTSRMMWQHPFVNIFKQFKIESWKRSSKEGDVASVMDKQLKCTVFRILGSIPAANYIQIPRTSTQSLGLTGRYLYILFKPLPTRYFVVHIDAATEEGLTVRISFSNLFKEFKCTSTWLQFPFVCHAAKGSVEHCASQGAKADMVGAAPLAQKWTMLVLDLQYILSVYINRKYSHLKNLRICANLMIKNCFTSDIEYDPRLSFRHARELGIKSTEENLAPMPRDMNFHIPKNKSWDDVFDLVRFPTSPDAPSPTKPSLLPFDSIQRNDKQPLVERSQSRKSKRVTNGPPGTIHSPRREEGKTVDASRHGGFHTRAQHAISVATVPKKQPKNKPVPIVSELPPVGLSMLNSTDGTEPNDVTLVESGTGDIHIFTDGVDNRDVEVHRHFIKNNKGSTIRSIATVDPKMKKATVKTSARSSKSSATPRSSRSTKQTSPFQGFHTTDKNFEDMTCLQPDPILKMKHVIGFGSGIGSPRPNVQAYRNQAMWHPAGHQCGGNDVVVYAVHAVIVAMEIANGHQHFFVGHTDSVIALAFNDCSRLSKTLSTTSILASAQRGDGGIVRIWRFDNKKCLAIVKNQQASSMNILSFSASGAVLIGCGRDIHGKTLIIVWDTSGVLRHGTVSVMARARADIEITRLRICPTDDTRLVTCGRDNIRFWRVRSGQLRSCPVSLSQHKVGEVTDVTFSKMGKVSERNLPATSVNDSNLLTQHDIIQHSVYACTKGGYIIEIDFQNVGIKDIHRLLPTHLDIDDSQKGIRLNVIRFADSYLATGSDDGFLRLWPLDLSTVFLEAKHEGSVVDIDLTKDGMKVLASTTAGTLGYLDVSTRQYTTVMRSHVGKITDCCFDGLRKTIATCSEDGSIRMWDFSTLRQLYDFTTPDDTPTSVSCHPTLEIFACGFESGAVRVFHVKQISLLSEHQIHSSKVTGVIFAPSGEFLYSAEVKGTVTLYDTSDVEKTGSAVIRALPRAIARGDRYGPRSIAVAPDSRRIAFVGPTEYTVTVAAAATLDELLRIDISTGLHLEPDILKQKPTVDCPLRVCFSTSSQHHLMVVTTGNRLLKLGLKDGCLLSITENIHRSKATSVCVSDDGKYFATAGDNVVKVWDYELSKDINFQVFIGHCGMINRVLFTPDQSSIISCGQEGIFLWDFLGQAARRFNSNEGSLAELDIRSHREKIDENILSVGRYQRKDLLTTARRTSEESDDLIPTRDIGLHPQVLDDDTPQPRLELPKPTAPKGDLKKKSPARTENSGWIPPDTLRTVDLDATDVSEFTLDTKMMANCKITDQPEKPFEHHTNSKLRENPTTTTSTLQDDPIKVFWGSNTVKGREALSPIKKVKDTEPLHRSIKPTTIPTGFSEQPPVLKHFCASKNTSTLSHRRYAPRKGEEGLKLESVIGYNGNGRGNMVWNPDTGVFAYSSGCIVVLEDLANGTQRHLTGHSEEISTMALQHDSQILACASCENGMVHSEIGLWDVESGQCRATLKHHEHDVVAMEYSRDDRFLVSIGDYRENTVVLWSGYDSETKPTVLTSSTCKYPIHHITWDPTAPNEFVTVGQNSSILFWLVEECGSEVQLQYHEGQIPDSVTEACGAESIIDIHFTSACYGTDKVLYAGTNKGVVTAWDTQTNECFLHWKADTAEICVLLSKGARLISGGVSRNIRLWTLTAVQEAQLSNKDSDLRLRGLVMEDELSLHSEITSAVFDETLDLGIVSTTAGTLWYVDWNSHNTVRMVTGHKAKINGITFDDGQYYATCSEEGSVRLWSVKTLELTVQFQVIDQPCGCVIFSHAQSLEDLSNKDTQPDIIPPANKMLAAGYGDGTLRVFDVDKLILMLKLQPHSTKVTAIAFSSDNCTLLSGSHSGRIAITSLSTGVTLRVLDDHLGSPITQLTVSTRQDHPASISAHLTEKDSRRDGSFSTSSVWLATAANRRVSVWVSCWNSDQCDMVDWLTFPAPCFAPDGTEISRNDKSSVSLLPPSCCIFHPSNPDLLVYTGYGMEKFVQLYSLAKRKVVKTFSIPNWTQCLDACNSISSEGTRKTNVQLLALGTESRIVELVDACHGTFQDFCGHFGPINHVKFSPDGKLLLTASGTELLLWKVIATEN
uniref:WD repeat-containing protein 90-like n=1 Tax=Styela clava TaxID=7725 RepID=UPI001939D6AB|nr:WD repeat-containing protein 90-like [Styela clava]